MKEMSDEELQQWLENKQQLPEGSTLRKDADAYRALFEVLGEEPENGLPYDFAAKVTRHINGNEQRDNELKYNLVTVFIFIAALAASYGLLMFFIPEQTPALLKYKWILLLFPPAFIIVQYFDQRLVKVRMFKRSNKP
jgi:hypothetical protein